jgi:hypothetical protein
MSKINIPVTVDWGPATVALNNMFTELYGQSGGASYFDGQYTQVSPFVLLPNVDTALPNNKQTVDETQKPSDVTTFYDGTKIILNEGDIIALSINFTLVPTVTATDEVVVWVDSTGGTGVPAVYSELFKSITSFKQLVGAERNILYTANFLAPASWATNGGAVKIRSNGTSNIYNIYFTISRIHKAQ